MGLPGAKPLGIPTKTPTGGLPQELRRHVSYKQRITWCAPRLLRTRCSLRRNRPMSALKRTGPPPARLFLRGRHVQCRVRALARTCLCLPAKAFTPQQTFMAVAIGGKAVRRLSSGSVEAGLPRQTSVPLGGRGIHPMPPSRCPAGLPMSEHRGSGRTSARTVRCIIAAIAPTTAISR